MGEHRKLAVRDDFLEIEEALYDGVQPWMANSIRNWLEHQLTRVIRNTTYYENGLMHQIELKARINVGAANDGYQLYHAVLTTFSTNYLTALDIVQAALELQELEEPVGSFHRFRNQASSLDKILIDGGSKWHVVVKGNKALLEARVNTTTEKAYNALVGGGEEYADYLQQAWSHAFGRKPNPSDAYTYAVKAVESASWSLVSPKSTSATLGNIIKDFRSQTDAGKFTTIFNDRFAKGSIDTIISMMEKLWHGHSDRHPTGQYSTPSQAESAAAIHLAISLCYFFSHKTIIRLEKPTTNRSAQSK